MISMTGTWDLAELQELEIITRFIERYGSIYFLRGKLNKFS
jgi:hypothetical protein